MHSQVDVYRENIQRRKRRQNVNELVCLLLMTVFNLLRSDP